MPRDVLLDLGAFDTLRKGAKMAEKLGKPVTIYPCVQSSVDVEWWNFGLWCVVTLQLLFSVEQDLGEQALEAAGLSSCPFAHSRRAFPNSASALCSFCVCSLTEICFKDLQAAT